MKSVNVECISKMLNNDLNQQNSVIFILLFNSNVKFTSRQSQWQHCNLHVIIFYGGEI